MSADVATLYERSRAKQRKRTIRLILLTLAGLAVALVLLTSHRPNEEPIHEHNGVTWVGDQCFVDDEDVVWCMGGES